MTTATATRPPGPMETTLRDLAYIGENDGVLLEAIWQDATRAHLLAACEALEQQFEIGYPGYSDRQNAALALVASAIALARGTQ